MANLTAPKTAQSTAPQEMGRSKFTHPGREPSVVTAGSSFPFLKGKERFLQLGKHPISQNLKGGTTLIKPITGTMHHNLSMPSAGTATSACPPHSNHKHNAIHAGTNQY